LNSRVLHSICFMYFYSWSFCW